MYKLHIFDKDFNVPLLRCAQKKNRELQDSVTACKVTGGCGVASYFTANVFKVNTFTGAEK